MGKENTIRTGTSNVYRGGGGVKFSNYNLKETLPSSTYSYGVVLSVDLLDKSIVYNIIEDNLGIIKTGSARPLYPNKIQLPNIGYIVPLLRAPSNNIGVSGKQYSKEVYYLDPIGIQQTVDKNLIIKEPVNTNLLLLPESNVNINNIKQVNNGIPFNYPKGNIIPCPEGLYGVFWNRMPFGFKFGRYIKGLKVQNHETHIHISFRTPQKAIEIINLAISYGLYARENAYIEDVDGAHSSAGTWHKKTFTKGYRIVDGTPEVIITNKEDFTDPRSIDPKKRVGMALDVRADKNESYNFTKETFQRLEAFFYKICNISNYTTNWR